MKVSSFISKNTSWIESMHQKDGYYGPVIHYWRKNLDYIGPGYDWRYEGIITGYLNLYEKFKEKNFFEEALKCGYELINAQLKNGFFRHSKFEANPSFRGGDGVHESGADNGLLMLSKTLKSEKDPRWSLFYLSAKKNIHNLLIKNLWDDKVGAFYQYPLRKRFVFNKISTMIESLLLLQEFVKENKYLKYCIKSGDYLVKNQNKDGSLPQEKEDGESYRIISYYNARSIPSLLKLYEITNDEKYLSSALKLGSFVKKMRRQKGGYKWGFELKKNKRVRRDYPVFVAGSADIIRSLNYLRSYGFKFNTAKDLNWIMKNSLPSGGVKSLIYEKDSCLNIIPSVGWNDKVLRLFSEVIDKNEEVPSFKKIKPCKIKCRDGFYFEDENKIEIIKKGERITFEKNKIFSSITPLKTKIGYASASVYTRLPKPPALDKIMSSVYNKLWNR